MKPANFAPVYACLYPQLAEIARSHGYALAVHGTLARDFDLVCIPWVDEPSDPQVVVAAMVDRFAMKTVGDSETRQHGRVVYTLAVKFGECFIDLSFMPVHSARPAAEDHINNPFNACCNRDQCRKLKDYVAVADKLAEAVRDAVQWSDDGDPPWTPLMRLRCAITKYDEMRK